MHPVATTAGLYPLPDDAREDLADRKGHQREDLVDGDEDPAVTAVYDRAREAVVADQRDAGLDRVVEGQLRWDDMLAHPLTVHDAVEPGGLVRYFDNNNFYRDPVVAGDLEFDGDIGRDLETAAAHADALQAVLPGPHTLATLATDEHYGDPADFLAAVGSFLAGEAAAFPDAVETLFLLEPALVTDPPGDGPDERASDAVDEVASSADCDVVVHTYWGTVPEKPYAHLLDADVDAVGYDFVSDPEGNLELVSEYGAPADAALGLLDAQSTTVESPETIRERVEWVRERLPAPVGFDRAYVLPNTELFYLPTSTYRAKLDALGAAVADLEVVA